MQDQALPFLLCKLFGSCTALQNTNIIYHCGISILPSVVVADFSFQYIFRFFLFVLQKTPTTVTKSQTFNADSDAPQASILLGIKEEQRSNGKITTLTAAFS